MIGVVTSIQEPTPSLVAMAKALGAHGSALLLVGDAKGPARCQLEGVELLSLADQRRSPFALGQALPTGHYARKNLGYLEAIRRGAEAIFETDDDNAPASGWRPCAEHVEAAAIDGAPWVNVYRLFSSRLIWPRGFPLERVREATPSRAAAPALVRAPIQQGLVDGSPDVDAIWRLVLDEPVAFAPQPSVRLAPGSWCPFNSQNTWWFPAAYPLCYLPSTCSFRLTDIWRSFVAQRCLWELGLGVVFHAADMIQERNPHNLMHDFAQEVPGYQRNQELCDLLAGLTLAGGADAVADNLTTCYAALVEHGFFAETERALLDAWRADLARARGTG